MRSRLPLAIAIAAASETFNPFRSRESLPYVAIDASLRLENRRLVANHLSAKGPTLRMVATGSVELGSPHPVEAVVGLFFFRGIDVVLGKVPILNTLLLGSDESLIPAYFSIEGPWKEPNADLIPVKSLLAGPASFVVEGVPGFVRGGMERLGQLFSLKPSESPAPRDNAGETATPGSAL